MESALEAMVGSKNEKGAVSVAAEDLEESSVTGGDDEARGVFLACFHEWMNSTHIEGKTLGR